MGSALLDTSISSPGSAAGDTSPAAGQSDAANRPAQETLRLQVAERLAAHRSRRARNQGTAENASASSRPADSRAARIAATVAQRYANSQSYRAFLAAETERAVQQAQAAAAVAALNAQAIAAAQQQLLDAFDQATPQAEPQEGEFETPQQFAEELSFWPEIEPAEPAHREPMARTPATPRRVAAKTSAPQVADTTETANAGFTVRLYEDAMSRAHVAHAYTGISARVQQVEHNQDEARALDEEIAFRQSPVFEEPAGPPMALPANLIEFPRQLVASRKARPRYAEGPLRDEGHGSPGDGQLRIFEVEPAQISTSPEPETAEETAAQWTSIWLDAPSSAPRTVPDTSHLGVFAPDTSADPEAFDAGLPDIASIGRRFAATAVDACVIGLAAAAFTAAFVTIAHPAAQLQSFGSARTVLMELAGRMPAAPEADPRLWLSALAVTGVFLYLLYQALFFSFSQATPGMRCARIALCTFDDNNPTHKAMRRRIGAVLLSACPLGLGFLWIALDEERLGWHDRISRIYQRSY
jgi:uncharacterized RDD family membrane protein YckC